MTTTTTAGTTARTILRWALAILAIAAVTLVVLVERQPPPEEEVAAPSGDVVALHEPVHAHASTVLLPGGELTIAIGHPLTRIDWGDVVWGYDPRPASNTRRPSPDVLAAPNGGQLVPVSWRFTPVDGIGREDTKRVTLRLVGGDQSSTLVSMKRRGFSVTDTEAAVVSMTGQPDDLAVEVEFDGVVQRLDAGTGEVDPGAAHGLYDTRRFDTFCEEAPTECEFSAASPDQPLLPSDVGFIAGRLGTYGYDEELGWPPEGTVWASMYAQVFGGSAYNSAGASFHIPATQPTRFTLRGSGRSAIQPTLNEITDGNGFGRVVFALPTDVEPSALVLRQRANPEDTTQAMPLVARVPLR